MISFNRIAQYAGVTYLLISAEFIQAQVKQDAMCKHISKSPNFDLNRVVGQPWRYYYTWMINIGDHCFNLTFVRATKTIIDRIGLDMVDYMRDIIVWEKATMMTSIVKTAYAKLDKPREVLLFPDEGNPGEFRGVPNMANDFEYHIPKYSLTTTHLAFKIYREGKFVVMADCNLGVAALMARGRGIYMSEILATAAEIWPEEGYLSCSEEKNENEIEGSLLDPKDVPNKY